ncbi:MAG: hypothetical protein GY867_08595 [bacterium]|nr:hypothetical protein [bacterium]
MESPYLWKRGHVSKPLYDSMGIYHRGRSEAVNRALVDFGAEDSFALAAKRFAEHYKFELPSSTVARVTKETAAKTRKYLDDKLRDAGSKFGSDDGNPREVDNMLVEVDGCEIRTATLSLAADDDGAGSGGKKPAKKKTIKWRDVRVGFARPLDSASKTYIGGMDKYEEVIGRLFDASVLSGMTADTKVIGVADGGIGIMEELQAQFPGMQFILDKTHLKDHLYETAEELGIAKKGRPCWVEARLDRISNGEVAEVKEELERDYSENRNDRLRKLIGYVSRFENSLNYADYANKGYPIGSGEVESAHKYVPQKRMKIPGACWHPDSVNPILALRVLRANDWWEEFWVEHGKRKKAA